MDIFFQDPSEVPLPPEEVRIRSVQAEPWPDGRRVKLTIVVDPFQKRPNADISVTSPSGREVAEASIIESMTRQIEITMHLRGELPHGEYTVQVVLFYTNTIQPPEEAEGDAEEQPSIDMIKVDQAQTQFNL